MRAHAVKLYTADLLWPNVERLGQKLLALGRKKIDLDFRDVEFVTAAALGKLMSINKKRRLALCNVRPDVHDVFDVTGLSAVFEIRPSARRRAARPR